MPPAPHPDERVFLLLSQTHALSRRLADAAVSSHRITIPEYSVLRILQNTPCVTASEIGRRLSASAASMAQLMKSLERKGLIRRSADATDIRRQLTRLTPAGTKTIIRARAEIQKTLGALGVSQDVLASLTRDLSALLFSLSPYGENLAQDSHR